MAKKFTRKRGNPSTFPPGPERQAERQRIRREQRQASRAENRTDPAPTPQTITSPPPKQITTTPPATTQNNPIGFQQDVTSVLNPQAIQRLERILSRIVGNKGLPEAGNLNFRGIEAIANQGALNATQQRFLQDILQKAPGAEPAAPFNVGFGGDLASILNQGFGGSARLRTLLQNILNKPGVEKLFRDQINRDNANPYIHFDLNDLKTLYGSGLIQGDKRNNFLNNILNFKPPTIDPIPDDTGGGDTGGGGVGPGDGSFLDDIGTNPIDPIGGLGGQPEIPPLNPSIGTGINELINQVGPDIQTIPQPPPAPPIEEQIPTQIGPNPFFQDLLGRLTGLMDQPLGLPENLLRRTENELVERGAQQRDQGLQQIAATLNRSGILGAGTGAVPDQLNAERFSRGISQDVLSQINQLNLQNALEANRSQIDRIGLALQGAGQANQRDVSDAQLGLQRLLGQRDQDIRQSLGSQGLALEQALGFGGLDLQGRKLGLDQLLGNRQLDLQQLLGTRELDLRELLGLGDLDLRRELGFAGLDFQKMITLIDLLLSPHR